MQNNYFDPIEIENCLTPNWTYYNFGQNRSYSVVRQCKQIGRRKQAEDILLFNKNLEYIYEYAHEVVKGRWEEAGEIIMESAHYSNLYARNVIKGKLPEKMHNFMIANGMIEKINRKEKESVRHYFDFLKFSPTNNK